MEIKVGDWVRRAGSMDRYLVVGRPTADLALVVKTESDWPEVVRAVGVGQLYTLQEKAIPGVVYQTLDSASRVIEYAVGVTSGSLFTSQGIRPFDPKLWELKEKF